MAKGQRFSWGTAIVVIAILSVLTWVMVYAVGKLFVDVFRALV